MDGGTGAIFAARGMTKHTKEVVLKCDRGFVMVDREETLDHINFCNTVLRFGGVCRAEDAKEKEDA